MIDERTATDLLHRAAGELPVGAAPVELLRARRRRHAISARALHVAAVALATVAVVAVPLAVSRLGERGVIPPVSNGRVSPPPFDAAPADVVRVYVAALDTGDITTAKSLSTPEHVTKIERAQDSWYSNVVSITDLRVEPTIRETGTGTQGEGYAEVVFVPVRFMLELRSEVSMTDGETVWGYRLARRSAHDRWLIVDEGPI